MNASTLTMRTLIEHWPLAQAFAISRGTKTEAVTVTVEISDGKHKGRGECTPYARYGETPGSVMAALETVKSQILQGLDRSALQYTMPAGAARNAVDCALWDLQAKREGLPVFELAGLAKPQPLVTAYTISLAAPDVMGNAAAKASAWPLLKIKLGQPGDFERLRAVRNAAPKAELIIDANEGWTPADIAGNFAACAAAGVTLIEQPLPQANDTLLASIPRPVPVCADESLHDRTSLPLLKGKYDAVNIKLDKAGGLTEALQLTEAAIAEGFTIMAGCMVATSLAIAPALLFAQKARVADLDGPLWLAKDRPDGLRYDDYRVYPATAALWG